ncbi:MAG TPA: periplasmic heavy metal sensor [Thermoanaerobaculia bacterium]|nr:periplasmic heavy metal sensor [Thermoanaerobaculia bacterium]
MKRMMLIAVLLAGTIAAEAAPPPRHMPRGRWWRHPATVQKLELNREQQRRLDDIFQNTANELIDAKAEINNLEVRLRGELDRSELRRAEIQRVATLLSAARARLFERELMMLVDMRGILEAHQWERLQEPGREPPGHFGNPH